MDLGQWTEAMLRANLADLERVNRFLGGRRTLTLHLYPRLKREWAARLRRDSSPPPITLVDVGTGPGDIPAHIARWARTHSIPVRILALDLRPEHLRSARMNSAPFPEIELIHADALHLPTVGADFVMASLVLHHFGQRDALRLLTEMGRVARRTVLVNDLIRSRVAYWSSPLVGRLLGWSPMTHHDGRLSILRAYTPSEALSLAQRSGLRNAQVHWHWPWRMCLVSDVG